MNDTSTPDIEHVETHGIGAFVIHKGTERIAEMLYRQVEDAETPTIVIEHTKVDESLRGQGIARALLDRVVAWARANSVRVRATCPYAKAQLDKDPSLHDVYDA